MIAAVFPQKLFGMNGLIIAVIAVIVFGAMIPQASAQDSLKKQKAKAIDTSPTVKEVVANRERLKISYQIPFDGVLELKIFNSDSVKIYHENHIGVLGLNTIRVKFKNPKSGSHTYLIEYKGHQLTGKFDIP
jgi:hypothetical protein